jgi:hypothetical protein
LCGDRIGGTASSHAFVDPQDHWLCATCNERYAVGRDVSFLIEA